MNFVLTRRTQELILAWATEELGFGEELWILVGKLLAQVPESTLAVPEVYRPVDAELATVGEAALILSDIWGSPLAHAFEDGEEG